MEYQLYSKNVVVTDALNQYLDKRLVNVSKVAKDVVSCRIDLSRDSHHKKGEVFRAELNISIPGKLVRVVEMHQDMRGAIDLSIDKIVRQLKKFYSKKRDTSFRSARKLKE